MNSTTSLSKFKLSKHINIHSVIRDAVRDLDRITMELESKCEWALATNLVHTKISLLLLLDKYYQIGGENYE